MRKMWKRALAGVLTASMALSLAACGGSSSNGGSSADGSTTLEVWSSNLSDSQRENVKKLVAQYEEQTGVKVNYTEFSYDMLHDKILSAAAGGNTPDVAWGLPEWTGEFHSMGILEDLSDRYANWDDASVLSDAVMKGMSIGDEIIGVPYEMTVRAYLCHENIMEKGGASVPATWDDVLSMTDFNDKTGTYPYALACTGVRAPQEMIVYLAQKGLEICSLQDDGMYKNTWKDNADQLAAAADVFQFYKDCIDSGVVDPNSKSFGYEETDDNFVNGFSASYVTGNWLQEKEDANPEVMSDVTVEPIPVPEGGTPATYMELKPLFLFNTSKNNDAAFDFATYVCGKEWQQDVYSSASPRSDVTVPGKWTEDFQALSDNGVAFPPVTLGSISQAMIDSIAKVLQEGMTPQAAAEWLADAVNTSLEESGELSAS